VIAGVGADPAADLGREQEPAIQFRRRLAASRKRFIESRAANVD
jgi:hypothetical protein